MSYIRKCRVCGERISIRQMTPGQWVAFDERAFACSEFKFGI